MKYYLCLLSLLLSGKIFPQSYSKIPIDTSFFWKQSSSCNYSYQLRYFKDTTVSGKVYNKYSVFGGTSGTGACPQSFIKNGFLRQDTLAKKVIILDQNFIERPLYNFSKTVGDTLQIYDWAGGINRTYTVMNVFAGAQNIQGSDGMQQILFEGIGSHEGGLYASLQYYTAGNNFERLVCAGKISPFLVSNPPEVGFESQCFLSTGINLRRSEAVMLTIFPNPFSDRINLQFKARRNNLKKVFISNSLGQKVFEKDAAGEEITLQLNFLKGGIYFLTVEDEDQNYTFKIIKTE